MTIAPIELQVVWSAATSFALATGNSWEGLSDAMTMNVATGMANIQLKADQTTGTPASGDYVDFYVSSTLGDPDGAGASEYDTAGHDTFLARLNLNTDDPAIKTVNFPVPLVGFKIRAVGAGFASTDVCTISAKLLQATV